MTPIQRQCCAALIGGLLLGATGCGGGMPATGDTLSSNERPEVAAERKKVIQEFYDKGPAKSRPKAKK
jgi:hypothetical protein